MPSICRACAGFSLMEVMISIGLLATIMALALESLMAAQNYDRFASLQDDLAVESTRILTQIREDLSISAWEFPTEPRSKYDGVTPAADRGLLYYPFVQIQSPGTPALTDSLGTAFPWSHRAPDMVVLGGPPGVPSPTSWHDVGGANLGVPEDFTRSASAAFVAATSRGATSVAGMGTEAGYWNSSFFARSQELLFLRSSVAAWNSTSDSYSGFNDQKPVLQFKGTRQQWATAGYHDALQILHASGWYAEKDGGGNVIGWIPREIPGSALYSANDFPYGVVMEAGYLRLGSAGEVEQIGINWRTVSGRAFSFDYGTATKATEMAAYADDLQAFAYCVVPSPLGFGRLVRARKIAWTGTPPPAGTDIGGLISASGSSGMVVDRVLSDHVMRIVFDTYRTVPSTADFDINQVRIRLFLGARTDRGASITRLVETTVAMRGRNTQVDRDPNANDSNAQILGQSAIGLVR